MVFDLPHIFVVFNFGAGGNFISGVINSLTTNNLIVPKIAKVGSSHTLLKNTVSDKDYLSFGTTMEEHMLFESEDVREQYYLKNINEHCSNIVTPKIIWTHDFTNIALYRKYFKNSRILVITNDSEHEKLTAICMQVTKALMDSTRVSIDDNIWNKVQERWNMFCMRELSLHLPQDQCHSIVSNKFDEKNKDIITSLTIRMYLIYYGMLSLVESINYNEVPVYGNVLYPCPEKNQRILYMIGNTVNSYIDNECSVLPYRYLIENDAELMISTLSALLKRQFGTDELDFLRQAFNDYRSAQNMNILLDPVGYYSVLSAARNEAINKLKMER